MTERKLCPMNNAMEQVQQSVPETEPDMEMLNDLVQQAVAEKFAAAQEKLAQEKQSLHQQQEEMTQREKALFAREMRSFAREQLVKRNLPEVLLDALCCDSEEACLESLDKVEAAFRTAVQQGVVSRMRGSEPLRGDALSLDEMDDNAYYHATYKK